MNFEEVRRYGQVLSFFVTKFARDFFNHAEILRAEPSCERLKFLFCRQARQPMRQPSQPSRQALKFFVLFLKDFLRC